MDDSSTPKPRPDPAAKLLPGDMPPPPPPTGWQRFVPITLERTRKGTRVRVAWRQAMISLAVLTLVAWLGAASAAYLFVKYNREFSEVQFSHMLLMPWRLEEYREARGEFLIKRGKKDLRDQKYREAFYNLRVGISLSPKNREGRMLLAQFYVAWQRPDLARRILLDGIEFNKDDREYLQALFTYLLQQQSDFELVKITDGLIAELPPSPPIDERLRLIATAKSTAHFFRGNYDAAEDTIKRYRLNEAPDGKLLLLQIEWERGEREQVLTQLESLTTQFPNYEQIYNQYASYLREADRQDDLRRLCILRQIRFPDRPRPRIDLLYLLDKAQEEERVLNEIESIFRDHSKNNEILLAMADFAANTGRAALAKRIYDHCKLNRLAWDGPALMTVEAHIVSKDYQAALVTARQMLKENPEWGKRFYSVFNGLQAIANYGLDDTSSAQIFLNNFLNQSGVRADNLVAVSNRLMSVGAKQQARQVLDQAVRSDPLNQSALVGLIKLDVEIGSNADDLAVNVRTLLAMRKPPRAVLIAAFNSLGSDHYHFVAGRNTLLDDLRKTIDSTKTHTGKI
jgi:thioredoxin-like negative regulator of GroEL